VIDIYPEVEVVGSKVALMYLKGLTHRPFKQRVVKGGDTVDLGGGHVVEFVMAPNLHWPDTVFSFDHATGSPPPPNTHTVLKPFCAAVCFAWSR